MIKITKNVLSGLLVLPVLALGLALFTPVATPASAIATCDPLNPSIRSGVDCATPEGSKTELFGAGSIFTIIVNTLLFVIGAISVIMLIVGGIKYTVSNGDSAQVTSAKNTIMYAVVGLVIAFLAFAAVNWVLTSLTTTS